MHIFANRSSREKTIADDTRQKIVGCTRSRRGCANRVRRYAARQDIRDSPRHDTQHGKSRRHALPESQEAHLARFNMNIYK